MVCKVECTPQGSQRRFVVTNLSGQPGGTYRGFYVERGERPEQPIDELANRLDPGRLSAHGPRANAYRLLHVAAYGLVVLLREAAAAVAEVAQGTVSTLQARLWKVGAWVERKGGRICSHDAASWPGRALWERTQGAVERFTAAQAGEGSPAAGAPLGVGLGPAPPRAAGAGCGGECARRGSAAAAESGPDGLGPGAGRP